MIELKVASELLFKELEGIIKLAEESSANIDKIVSSINRIRQQNVFMSLAAYIVISTMGYLAYSFDVSGDISKPLKLTIFTSIIILFVFFYVLMKKVQQIRYLRRSLRVEEDIHHKLIIMLDEQLERVKAETNLSPVVRATAEMRIRRLDRTRIY